MHMSGQAFRRLVDEGLARVPAEFQPYLSGVPVVIADWPSEALLDDLGVAEDETLYGLYSGRALTDGPVESGELPPRITIFRGPLEEDCADEDELRDEVATTVIHELAHHFGIDEARLEELGLTQPGTANGREGAGFRPPFARPQDDSWHSRLKAFQAECDR